MAPASSSAICRVDSANAFLCRLNWPVSVVDVHASSPSQAKRDHEGGREQECCQLQPSLSCGRCRLRT
eukprot:3037792-Rhodomonas_salina.2